MIEAVHRYEGTVNQAEYTFKHALTHEVAYAGLLLERRRAVHARIVDAIQRIHAGRLEEQIEALAHHTFRAEQWEPAARLLRQAGDRARQRSANREAASLYEQALAALSHLPQSHERAQDALEIRGALRGSLLLVQDFRTILTHLLAMEADAAALGDQRWLGRIMAWRSECLRVAGDLAAAAAAGEGARVILADQGDALSEKATACFQLGLTYQAQGRHRSAVRLLAEAGAALRGVPQDQHLRVPDTRLPNMLGWQAFSLARLGEFEKALELATEAVALAESPVFVADPVALINGLWGLGGTFVMRGEVSRAIPLLERGRAIALEREVALLHAWYGSTLGYAHALLGRTAESLPLLEEAIVHWQAVGRIAQSAYLRCLLAEAHLLGSQPDEARRVVEDAIALARRHGERGNEAEALRILGECATAGAAAEGATARVSLEHALALAAELEMRPLVAHCHLGLGKLYRRACKRQEAHEHLTTATTMYREMDMRFWLEQAERETNLAPSSYEAKLDGLA
jgi:tetratricopeptide (TPR) repeat protein